MSPLVRTILYLLFLPFPVLPVFAAPPAMRVMTYNIRYDSPEDSLDNWAYRRDFIAGMIRYHQPDILGVQEGLIHQLRQLEGLLPEYRWVGKGRDDGKEAGEFSAILLRADRFIIEAEGTIWLSLTPDKPSRGWDAALNRIVTWVKLQDKSTGRSLFVFNTHFDHQGRTAREESAKLLLREVRRLAGSEPVIVTGDFNSTDREPPYAVLTATDDAAHLRLQDALRISQAGHHGPEKTYSGFDVRKGIIGERIDFIFVRDGLKVLRHAILSDFMVNEHFPSDHLPVVADVELP